MQMDALREVLSLRQEAILVVAGLLDESLGARL